LALLVKELIRTIQGEGVWSGYPCTLVRLSGCNLRCSYCDTTYAYEGGRRYRLDTLLSKIRNMGDDLVLVTGGEPLFQDETKELLHELAESGARVMLETNGSFSIEGLPPDIHIVMDLKCPGSGQEGAMHWPNLDLLKTDDEIKFVITDRTDYIWARKQVSEHSLQDIACVNFSPAFGKLKPERLAAWILKDSLPVRLNLQVHKFIWKDPRGK
jgi:7-carboxy-7-deazaguanine synthase